MANNSKTLEEILAEQGVISSYIWKPNRVFARSGDHYIPADVVSDGTADEVAREVREAGASQKSAIQDLGAAQLAAIRASDRDYTNVVENLTQTYTRMQTYFERHGMQALATIMATAIYNLNNP